MKALFSAAMALVTLNLFAAEAVPDWENPAVFAVGKQAPRATAWCYADEAQAAADDYRRSPYYLSLDGEWRFHWAPTPDLRPVQFYEETFDDSAEPWTTMSVPGNPELCGFGKPIYTNINYVFPKNPPFIDHSYNSVGSYMSLIHNSETTRLLSI